MAPSLVARRPAMPSAWVTLSNTTNNEIE